MCVVWCAVFAQPPSCCSALPAACLLLTELNSAELASIHIPVSLSHAMHRAARPNPTMQQRLGRRIPRLNWENIPSVGMFTAL